jgi:hypothetical protein
MTTTTATATNDKAIAGTILEQMGGLRRLALMTGAKDFMSIAHGVQFGLGRGAKAGIRKVRVILDADDTYTVEFYAGRSATSIRLIKAIAGVYADALMDIFEAETGFYLTLAPRR